MRSACLLAATALIVAGCGRVEAGEGPDGGAGEQPGAGESASAFGPAPEAGAGPVDDETEAALEALLDDAVAGGLDRVLLGEVAATGDPRLGWVISDLLRFTPGPSEEGDLLAAFERLVGAELSAGAPGFEQGAWIGVTDHLIAWDTPAPPGYRELKARLFTGLEPGWKPFFADAGSEIDWRLISWGGVLIDDRPLGDERPCPRGCIPALDDPELTPASEGGWYPEERTVFGIEVGGEAVALPKNIMEVHEMVNMTLGGRRLGIPYCTLCGSAQAYLTDADPSRELVLRTSGLLSRSNKVMYELGTKSVLDTFTGEALSGPLRDEEVVLEQASVTTSGWGEWKRAHPETRIVAEDGGIGRTYPLDPLRGRDDSGPIFPVGDVDPRLPVQAQVLGVKRGGEAIAFPAEQARAALDAGESVELGGVELIRDGGGLRAVSASGRELASHQAFWFAWSQFNPTTRLWVPPNR